MQSALRAGAEKEAAKKSQARALIARLRDDEHMAAQEVKPAESFSLSAEDVALLYEKRLCGAEAQVESP
eukprot:scaffold69478_cov22-Prasinocladus_malaysianus.AAC.1